MSAFAVPFHCPYCADEDLRPHGEQKGAWECRGCQRAFKLNYLGILAPGAGGPPGRSPQEPTTEYSAGITS